MRTSRHDAACGEPPSRYRRGARDRPVAGAAGCRDDRSPGRSPGACRHLVADQRGTPARCEVASPRGHARRFGHRSSCGRCRKEVPRLRRRHPGIRAYRISRRHAPRRRPAADRLGHGRRIAVQSRGPKRWRRHGAHAGHTALPHREIRSGESHLGARSAYQHTDGCFDPEEYIGRGGNELAGLQLYNGAPGDASFAYATRVIAERQSLQDAVRQARDRARA